MSAESWATWVGANALAATALAVVVALLQTRVRHAGLRHVAWGIVLLRLVMPPIVAWPVLPSWHVPAREHVPALRPTSAPASPSPSPRRHAVSATALPLVALAGSVFLLALAGTRAFRFARLVRHAQDAPPPLQARADRVARSLGLPRAPRLRLVPARIAPAVVALPRAEILFPAALAAALPAAQLDALLAHELAHIRRGDPWLRPLELFVVVLWWWHPVAWWARRNFRDAEERACDDLVVRRRPDRARDYADAIVGTLAFLASRRHATPALATGFDLTHLKERLVMILDRSPVRPLPRRWLASGVALLLAALVVTPASVVPAATPSSPAPVGEPDAPTPPPSAVAPTEPAPPAPPSAISPPPLAAPLAPEAPWAPRASLDAMAREASDAAHAAREAARLAERAAAQLEAARSGAVRRMVDTDCTAPLADAQRALEAARQTLQELDTDALREQIRILTEALHARESAGS